MSQRFWFRSKAFGYGSTPITWEGWLATLGSMIVTIVAILIAVLAEVRQWPDRRPLQAVCLVVLLATLIASIAVSRSRTNGDWRWRPWAGDRRNPPKPVTGQSISPVAPGPMIP